MRLRPKSLTASIAMNFHANFKVKADLKSLNKTLSTTNRADCSEKINKIEPSLVYPRTLILKNHEKLSLLVMAVKSTRTLDNRSSTV